MKEYSVWVDEAEKIVSFHEVDNSELIYFDQRAWPALYKNRSYIFSDSSSARPNLKVELLQKDIARVCLQILSAYSKNLFRDR